MSTCLSDNQLYALAPESNLHRWLLAAVMVATVALGWIWPVFGFTVPIAMAAAVMGAFSRGRFVCGNVCPRGSFYDTFFRLIGGSRPVPAFFSNLKFRWGVVVVLMSFMALQIAQDPTDPMHWGFVFWQVCAVTTAVGVALGLYYRPRTWCTFCPVGTMANGIGGGKYTLQIASNCKSCGVCERSCPMDLSIARHQGEGSLPHRDCLKCSSCVDSCKVSALSFAGAR